MAAPVHETRRIVGEYQLTEEDVLGCASFDDTIGVNGWPVEAHVKGDVVFKFQTFRPLAASTTCRIA